jgi:putative transposase
VTTLKKAKIIIEEWRKHCNTIRPHSSLGYVPPAPEVVLWPAAQPRPAPPATQSVALKPTMH